ncbi:MAG: ATP-binding protein, partial [Chloroflexota bacterium]
EIFPELWEDTAGQPWLVNALGQQMTWEDRAARDRSRPLTLEGYQAARERLIESRATHLDQLADKLREERVRKVMAPLLAGESLATDLLDDDREYCLDLGLVRWERPNLSVSNRIYREIIPRELSARLQDSMQGEPEQPWYVRSDHRLDMGKLLAAFQQFFREHSDAWLEKFEYREAGPQLLLQAFLQRVVNGGGRISREYGLGLRRTDLFVEWPLDEGLSFNGPVQRVVLELKLIRPNRSAAESLAQGLAQTTEYADRCGADEAHLILFDRRPGLSWEERLWHRRESAGKRAIEVWGS